MTVIQNNHLNNKQYINCSTSNTNYKKYFANAEGIEMVTEGKVNFVYIKKCFDLRKSVDVKRFF